MYPSLSYVRAATSCLIRQKKEELRLRRPSSCKSDSETMGESKGTITSEVIKLKRLARKRIVGGYGQRIRRMKQRLEKCDCTKKRRSESQRAHTATTGAGKKKSGNTTRTGNEECTNKTFLPTDMYKIWGQYNSNPTSQSTGQRTKSSRQSQLSSRQLGKYLQ